MVDSAAPSWGQNIQKMMITMMGKIDGTANEITEVKSLATNAKNEAAEASTAVNLLRAEVSTMKKDIIELQGSGDNSSRTRPSKSDSDDERKRTITFGKFAEDTRSEYIIETIEKLIENFKGDIEDKGIFAYGKKFATRGAARFKTEEAMWMYLKHENTRKRIDIDGHTFYVNRDIQGTSEDQSRTKAVRKLVRAIIEEEGGNAQTTKAKIDTNYRRGIVWYHDVRMGDFKDGQMELTNNGAKFGTKFKELME